jgi:hypothetical protein
MRLATADHDVEHPGIDLFFPAAPCDPHRPRIALSHQAVHIDAIAQHAEQGCGGALHQQQRRLRETGIDRIELVAPARDEALLAPSLQCFRHRRTARFRRSEPIRHLHRAFAHAKHKRHRAQGLGGP